MPWSAVRMIYRYLMMQLLGDTSAGWTHVGSKQELCTIKQDTQCYNSYSET
jgi:hypothetical protein